MTQQIYTYTEETIGRLLDLAKYGKLVVPFIQRDFVWTPPQISLLVDTMLHGWPFGSLLFWSMELNESEQNYPVPFRSFRDIIDNSDSKKNEKFVHEHKSAPELRLVLDGQQRLQSLVLAFHQSDSGIVLPDVEWKKLYPEIEKGKRKSKTDKATHGVLCLDVEHLGEHCSKEPVASIDFVEKNIICWFSVDGTGLEKKDKNKHIRLSELWEISKQPSHTLIRNEIQNKYSFASKSEIIDPIIEFIQILKTNIRESSIRTIVLKSQKESTLEEKSYNAAIVQIFTRLNTAGKILTHQEITFSWVKALWKTSSESLKAKKRKNIEDSAELAFKKLLEHTTLLQYKEDEYEELIKLVSAFWAVDDNKGNMIHAKDFVSRNLIECMVDFLILNWDIIKESCAFLEDFLVDQINVYTQKKSFSRNALIVVYAMNFLFFKKIGNSKIASGKKEVFKSKLQKMLSYFAEYWLLFSKWSHLWRESTMDSLSQYIKNLNEICSTAGIDKAFDDLKIFIDKNIYDMKEDVKDIVDKLSASSKVKTADYLPFLWLWQKDKEERLQMLKKNPIDNVVDHIISQKFCKSLKIEGTITHSLGNMQLLHFKDNSEKQDRSLADFMTRSAINVESSFNSSMLLSEEFLEPSRYNSLEIKNAILSREKEMKKEIKNLIDKMTCP